MTLKLGYDLWIKSLFWVNRYIIFIMKQLILTSSVKSVAHDLPRHFEKSFEGQQLVFISTAGETEEGDRKWLEQEWVSLEKLGFSMKGYTLTGKSQEQLISDLTDADVLFLSGGNPFYLLYQIQKSGFAKIAHDHVNAGKLYIGESSGTLVAGPDLTIAHREEALAKVPPMESYAGIGLVDFMALPHWGSDMARNLYLHHRMEYSYNTRNKIILLTDRQYVHVRDGWYQIVEIQGQ
jgi:dipeptidase E